MIITIKNKTIYSLLLLVCISFQTYSQPSNNMEDLKVGLVLSGGGAKGLAHIGVLKTIDSLGIKIDYIAGTSMGAVIGSLYASGYSGKELENIFEDIDFTALIGDEIPRASKSFFERNKKERYALSLPFDNFKVQLPSAISKGQNVYNLFSRLMLHVSDIDDFHDLPIPFFCIATDIETGEQVVIDTGSLPKAVAASGALPSLFQPVQIEGKILMDGGVINNYPIEELRAKGMDIIIGVDVQDSLATREALKSAPDILIQINNYRTINAMKDKADKTDIYIKPDITDFSVVSFDEGKQIIKNGEIAAKDQIIELYKLKDTREASQPLRKFQLNDSIRISSIRINGNDRYSRAYVKGKLKLESGNSYTYKTFIKGLDNLAGTENFSSILYEFIPSEGDSLRLDVDLIESKQTMDLKVGLHHDDLYKTAALVNVTKKKLLTNDDVASLDLIVGENLRYHFDYFIDKGFYWSFGLRSRYDEFDKTINSSLLLDEEQLQSLGVQKLAIELSDFTNQIYFQTLFRRDFALSLGAEHKHLRISSETIVLNDDNEEQSIFENSDFVSLFGTLYFDTYNDKYFPTKGFLFDGDFHWFISSSDYNNNFSPFSFAKVKLGYAFKLLPNLSAVIGSEGGFKLGEDSNNSLNFAFGGYGNDFINNFISFYGYDFISVTGNSFVKGNIDFDLEWTNNHHVSLGANYGNLGDDIFTNTEWASAPDFSGYALGYAYESVIGPIEVKYTWSPEAKNNIWFFSVGYWF